MADGLLDALRGKLRLRLVARLAWIVFAVRLVLLDGLEIARAHVLNDYASFHFAAFALREGKSPYDPAVLGALGAELGVGGVHPYFYPPFFAELLVPSSFLDPWVARVVFWIASTLALVYALWALSRSLERDEAKAAFAVAVAIFWPIHDSALMGQVNAIVLALVVAWWTNRKHGDRAAAFLGVAIAIKMSPALLVAFPLVRRRWKEASIAAGVGVGLVALSCLVLGARGLEFVRHVAPGFFPGRHWHGLTVPIDLVGNESIAAFSFALTGPHVDPFRLGKAATALQAGGCCAAFAFWLLRARRADDHGAMCSLLVLMMIAPTYCYEHHLVFALLAVAGFARLVTNEPTPLARTLVLGVALAIVAAPIQALVVPGSLAGKWEPFTRFPKLPFLLVAFLVPLLRPARARVRRRSEVVEPSGAMRA